MSTAPPPARTRRRPAPAWVATVLRLLAGGVFAWSGWTKITDLDGTVRSVRAYRLLPEAVVPLVGNGLPVLELGLAALLLTGLATRLAAGLTVLLALTFAIGVASAWARGLQIQCGCFGNGGYTANPVPGYVRELVLNTALVAAGVRLFLRPRSRWSADAALGLHPADDPTDDPTGDLAAPSSPSSTNSSPSSTTGATR